jgi:hypothetical protein
MIMKLLTAILPFIELISANKKIKKKISIADPEGIIGDIEDPSSITTEVLKDYYENSLEAKETFEGKAKTNVLGITVAISIIFSASNLLDSIYTKYCSAWFSWTSCILIVFSVLYMIIAGILSVQVLGDKNIIYVVKIASFAKGESALRSDYSICTQKNIFQNMIRNNYIFTAYSCIRNALICLVIVFALAIAPLTLDEPATDDSTTVFCSLSPSKLEQINMNTPR